MRDISKPFVLSGTLRVVLQLGWNIRTIAVMEDRGEMIVQPPFRLDRGGGQAWFLLTPQVSEVMVWRINGREPARPVPDSAGGFPLDEGTMAYRLAMAITEHPIDYAYRYPELFDELRECFPNLLPTDTTNDDTSTRSPVATDRQPTA